MPLYVRDGGVWKSPVPYVKDGGTWKAIQQMYVRDGGTWKLVFQAGPAWNRVPGTYAVSDSGTVSITISADVSVTWTYTKSSSITANRASGSAASSITFSLQNTSSTIDKTGTVTLTGTVGGVPYNWNLTLTAYMVDDGGGGGGGPIEP